ncbi:MULTISPECIES: NACHT domain-containing protein [Actinosynnema]|uniref:NACHT domain-containing protein n=1 Tax=Actinosynnema TaxID=40566 RepID=UPI0020A4E4AC|nr:NACHT domain-containing protein [Actinosynnema pretiosum]
MGNRVGDVDGTVVQAGVVHGGVHVHATAPSASHADGPGDWSARLPAGVRALLRAQAQAEHRFPYRLPGARSSLAAVHVRQELGVFAEEPERGPAERRRVVPDGRGGVVEVAAPTWGGQVVRPPARPLREVLDGDAHLVVTGGAGQGKSTLLLRLAADVARRWEGEGDPLAEAVVPLRVTARELAARLDLPFFEALALGAHAEYGALLGGAVDPSVLASRVGGCRWLLLVDALDEVADVARRERLAEVLALWASAGGHRVLLTTRPVDGADPLRRVGALRYELLPFDEAGLRVFAGNWFGAEVGRRFVRQVRAAGLVELVRLPLLATIAAILFERWGDRPLPDSRYELFEAYLGVLRGGGGVFEPWRAPLLEHLGRTRRETDVELGGAAVAWVGATVPGEVLGVGWREELAEFLVAVGPLVVRGGGLEFLHHSFAEHLSATAQARELPRDGFDGVGFGRLLHAALPRERGRYARTVLLHHARLWPERADGLLRLLNGGGGEQHLLAARLLAGHLPAGAEAVEEFLVTARGWAMTAKQPEVLEQVGRARHPGLAGWLTGLVHDGAAPWRSRVEAATALAVRLRVGGAAVEVLCAAVGDEGVAVGDRLAAAEALAEWGGEEARFAEGGLWAVLVDARADGEQCRKAAVTLAGFGGEAAGRAARRLLELVGDPFTANADLVELASGVVEIDGGFAGRAVEVFTGVLRDRVHSTAGVRDAALGLVALGEERVAVEALGALIGDHGRNRYYRIKAALVLAELGAGHREVAERLVWEVLGEQGVQREESALYLAHCVGFEAEESAFSALVGHLADPTTDSQTAAWAAESLADFAPEHHDEAAEWLVDVARSPLLTAGIRLSGLSKLATLGGCHRREAVAALRAAVADHSAPPHFRGWAAEHLSEIGPEFHPEVIAHFESAVEFGGPQARAQAWCQLLLLGNGYRERALTCLADLLAERDVAMEVATSCHGLDLGHLPAALEEVVRGAGLSDLPRLKAARALVSLRHQGVGIAGFGELVRTTLPWKAYYHVRGFIGASAGHRGQVAEAFDEVIADPWSTAGQVWEAHQAVEVLGFPSPRLTAFVTDPAVPALVRGEASVLLAQRDPERASASVLLAGASGSWRWRAGLLALLDLGVAVPLEDVARHPDTGCRARVTAAAIAGCVAELRALAQDENLGLRERFAVVRQLAETDPGSRAEAVAWCRRRMREGSAEASYHLVLLDRACAGEVAAVLRRMATTGLLEERVEAVTWLGRLTDPFERAAADPAAALVRHPEVRGREVLVELRPEERIEAERALLGDRSRSVEERLPVLDAWGDLPLAGESEAEIRDVLGAVESGRREVVEAAVGLRRSSRREAAVVLEREGAWAELAGLCLGQWEVVRARLQGATRWRDVETLVGMGVPAGEVLVPGRGGEYRRAWGSRLREDFARLRVVLADESAGAAVRVEVARWVRELQVCDRALAVRVLDQVVRDSGQRAALRVRAVEELRWFGENGERLAEDGASSIAFDAALPVTARARAACLLGVVSRARRREVAELLLGLDGTPLQRREVLLRLGKFDSAAAVRELRALARGASGVVRLRCAQGMVAVRRDQRDAASAVVRSVAFDGAVARHVRVQAARELARWSEVCRGEARELLGRLGVRRR